MRPSDCAECKKGHAFCVYCQKRYASPGRLHTHIEKMHSDTIRRRVCEDAAPYEFEEKM